MAGKHILQDERTTQHPHHPDAGHLSEPESDGPLPSPITQRHPAIWKSRSSAEVKAMKQTKTKDVVLTLFGLLCLAAYILACRPTFSPDGSRILFPSVNTKAKEFSVVLYDRTTQEAETILTLETSLASAQWSTNGQEVIVVWREREERDDNPLSVMVLPVGGKNPTRRFVLQAERGLGAGLPWSPPPVVGDYLFLGGETSVCRVNLETGETKKEDFGEELKELLLSRQGDQVYYLARLRDEADRFEIGTIDRETVSRIPIFQIEARDVGEMTGFLAISRDGFRIAIVGEKPHEPDKGNLQRIVIFRGNRLETAIPVGSEVDPIALGNTEWSPDGATLYAAFSRKLGDEGGSQLGVLEIPVAGTGPREIPLLNVAENSMNDFWLQFQIALSPDGMTIAAASTTLDSVMEEDRALYLVDLATPERKVTKIPIPYSATSRPAQDQE